MQWRSTHPSFGKRRQRRSQSGRWVPEVRRKRTRSLRSSDRCCSRRSLRTARSRPASSVSPDPILRSRHKTAASGFCMRACSLPRLRAWTRCRLSDRRLCTRPGKPQLWQLHSPGHMKAIDRRRQVQQHSGQRPHISAGSPSPLFAQAGQPVSLLETFFIMKKDIITRFRERTIGLDAPGPARALDHPPRRSCPVASKREIIDRCKTCGFSATKSKVK